MLETVVVISSLTVAFSVVSCVVVSFVVIADVVDTIVRSSLLEISLVVASVVSATSGVLSSKGVMMVVCSRVASSVLEIIVVGSTVLISDGVVTDVVSSFPVVDTCLVVSCVIEVVSAGVDVAMPVVSAVVGVTVLTSTTGVVDISG